MALSKIGILKETSKNIKIVIKLPKLVTKTIQDILSIGEVDNFNV